MTLDRATVEQMLETIAGDSYLNARDARALAEDWLRMQKALKFYADRRHYIDGFDDGQVARAALAAPVEAPTAHTDEALTECVHHYKMVVGGMQCAKCGRTIQ